MNIDSEVFETGWFDVFLRLSQSDVDDLIENLQRLKKEPEYFFNIQNKFDDPEPNLSNLVISLIEGLDTNAEMYP